jgi:nitrogen fixation protein NifU and related proteins
MDLSSIYSEIVLEHNKNLENKRKMEDPDIIEKGHNPSCGDNITLQLKITDNRIEDAAYVGVGCALSQASTSLMIDLIKGKSIAEALESTALFMGMIKSEIQAEEDLEPLGDAMYLQSISKMPARVKCAVLAWHTLKEALESQK